MAGDSTGMLMIWKMKKSVHVPSIGRGMAEVGEREGAKDNQKQERKSGMLVKDEEFSSNCSGGGQ